MCTRTISVFEYYYVYVMALVPRPRKAKYRDKQIYGIIANYKGQFLLTFEDKSQQIVSDEDTVELEE